MNRLREHMLEQFENAPSGDHAQNVVQFSADTTQQRTSSALDLVSQVASIIRGLQERAAETEARARALAESALDRLRQAETRGRQDISAKANVDKKRWCIPCGALANVTLQGLSFWKTQSKNRIGSNCWAGLTLRKRCAPYGGAFSPDDLAPLRRGFFGVPSMIDSLEVEVLHPA
jgi:hypothetical protein